LVKPKKCTFKDDLIFSLGQLPLDSTGTSTCQFCICFGREGTPPAEAFVAGSTGGAGASMVLPKKKRAVSRRHLKFDDFSRDIIEEHYTKSHPKQWASYQRAVSQRGRSSKTDDSFLAQKGKEGISIAGTRWQKTRFSQRPSGTFMQGYFRSRRTLLRELPPAYVSRRLPQRMAQAMKMMAMTIRSSSSSSRCPPGRLFSA
jgi:hypothetical protein